MHSPTHALPEKNLWPAVFNSLAQCWDCGMDSHECSQDSPNCCVVLRCCQSSTIYQALSACWDRSTPLDSPWESWNIRHMVQLSSSLERRSPSGLSYPLAVCWTRGRGHDKCLHAIHATIYILRDSQSGTFSCQCSDSDKTETSPLEILHKSQNIGIWSSPLLPLPGRIWQLGIFPQSCNTVLGEGLLWGSISAFPTSFDVVDFLLTLGAVASQLFLDL